MARTLVDDLGATVDRPREVRHVVSLVPSLTEAIASVRPDALVGVTDWCSHPPDLTAARIRGTKNPDLRRIVDLAPDLVIANKEENREHDVRRLREAGVPVWVTDIATLEQAFTSLERLFDEGLGWDRPSWLAEARRSWVTLPSGPRLRVTVPIWRDPWMVVGPRTFTADLLWHLGCEVVPFPGGDRYPQVDVKDLDTTVADLILLPDEPYVFTAEDGPESFTSTPTQLVSGRLLTWYGPSLVSVREELATALAPWRSLTR